MSNKSFFEDLQKRIAKNVKGVHASIMSQSEIASVSDWVKTPSLDLNRILSGDINKGIPNRSLVGIVGPEHTMKSSFMVLCMAEAQKKGYSPIIIDTERGTDKDFCIRWGLDVENTQYIYTPWENEIRSILAQIKGTGQKRMIIGIDSMGGVDRYKMYEDALDGDPKADQGLLQKNIRALLKLLLNICIEQESIGIVTGHLYGLPGVIPMPDQVGGGKAMRLFPSILINLKKTPIKVDKKITGNEITAVTIKNRMYPPFQQATVSIDYVNGINPYAGLLTHLITAGLVKEDGKTYTVINGKKEEKLGIGWDKSEANLSKYPEVLLKFNEWLKQTGYSTINKETEAAIGELEDIAEEEISKINNNKKKKHKSITPE
ncbi:MAG TPA: hypothetical protein P5293_01115 [Bacteroidales bacterium]|nr:hypothetical protein [Bacteroidales bacterium]